MPNLGHALQALQRCREAGMQLHTWGIVSTRTRHQQNCCKALVQEAHSSGGWDGSSQCQHNQLMPFCACPTQHFKQPLSFALSALLFRWGLGGIHTPVLTNKVLVTSAKVALKLLTVFNFKSFTNLFSFLCHDTKWFWVLQLRDVLNRWKESICQRE